MGFGPGAFPLPVLWGLVLSGAILGLIPRSCMAGVPLLLSIALPTALLLVVVAGCGFAEQGFPKSARSYFVSLAPAFGSSPLKLTREVCGYLGFVAVAG